MTSVDLEYAHLLATTLMFKRFGDEKPKFNKICIIKSITVDTEIGFYFNGLRPDDSLLDPEDDYWIINGIYSYVLSDDLWLYLSDLDVLRVKGE